VSAAPEPVTARRTGPPSGTVTFAFTDIEGSTVRWERDHAAMADSVRRHDGLVRAAIEAQGGHVFKTIGDAFCAAFARAKDAVAAMLAAQQALAGADFSAVDGLRVRAALHTGTSDERDGDYFGPTVNRVARLLAIGHGGQVLLSTATAELVKTDLGTGVHLLDLGSHRLKDLAHPEHVYQLTAPGLVRDFPPLRSLAATSHNLPSKLSSLVGREPDVAELSTLLRTHRLVTIVGAGGVGKTRTSLHVATTVLEDYADGAWFIELAPLSSADPIPSTIAQAMSLTLAPDAANLGESLLAALKGKHALLVVDNCEHLIEPVAQLLSGILRSCPRISVLASSRQGLAIDGEQCYRLPSLAVPRSGEGLTAAAALQFAAVALFVERARSADKRFTLTSDNAADVAEICRRLDGIPLAIELAAPRVKILSPRSLRERLNERFRMLTGGSNDALPRQQTLRATIEWSYDLLGERERRFLCRLSVFAGTFTLNAASAVAPEEAPDEFEALELAGGLVDKSLVVEESRDSGFEERFRLSETVRAFGLERLDAWGVRAEVMRLYAASILTFLERAAATWVSTPSLQWLHQVEPELDNVREVLQWTLDLQADVELGLRVAAASRRYWGAISPLEGARWVADALSQVTAESRPEVVAGLHLADAQMRTALQQHAAARASAERACELYERLGNAMAAAEARGFTGLALSLSGKPAEGISILRRTLADYERLGSQHFVGHTYSDLGMAYASEGDLEASRVAFRQALHVFHSLDYDRETTSVAGNLAELEYWSGDTEAAVRLCLEAISGTADPRSLSMYAANLTAYYVALDRWDDARERARFVLERPVAARADIDVAFVVQHVAAIAALDPSEARGRATAGCERAAHLLGYVDAWLERMDNERQQSEQREYDRVVAAARAFLGEDGFTALLAEGRAWNERRALAEAALVCSPTA
jgi:predicted ATPase/class 3 adenylate cyclase